MIQDLMIAGTTTPAAFAVLLGAWEVPDVLKGQTLILLESMPHEKVKPEHRQDLLRFEVWRPDMDITAYSSGRVFHESGEIRWERTGIDEVHVVYTGVPAYQPALEQPQAQTMLTDEVCSRTNSHAFLLGRWLAEKERQLIGTAAQEGDFAEVRIPRLLRYPRLPALKGTEYAGLALYEYTDLATGARIAYRFYGLVPLPTREEKTAA